MATILVCRFTGGSELLNMAMEVTVAYTSYRNRSEYQMAGKGLFVHAYKLSAN